MTIHKLEDIQAWQMARELTNLVYLYTGKPGFKKDFALLDQIRRASGSTMHNIAEGFDAGSGKEFIRFLNYAKRSCTEVQSQLYIALDQAYITKEEFQKSYLLASRTRAIIRGFIGYLQDYNNRTK